MVKPVAVLNTALSPTASAMLEPVQFVEVLQALPSLVLVVLAQVTSVSCAETLATGKQQSRKMETPRTKPKW